MDARCGLPYVHFVAGFGPLLRSLFSTRYLLLALFVPVDSTPSRHNLSHGVDGSRIPRAHFISGFPWYFLAHTQHEVLPVIQISDVTGAYGLSFLMAAANALAFELLRRWERFRLLSEPGLRPDTARIPLHFQVIGVLTLFCGVLVYGLVRLDEENFGNGPRLLLIQPNVPQQIRDDPMGGDVRERFLMTQYRNLTQKGLNEGPKPDLIVWPETCLPKPWAELSDYMVDRYPYFPALAAETHAEAIRLARVWHTDFLIGAETQVYEDEKKIVNFNSAILIRTNGRVEDRYNKIHRVPFGEYMPFRESIPWMDKFSPYDSDYSLRPGVTLNRFELRDFTFGVLICYEDTDPALARQYARPGADGKPVDFLVNISNDGWFDGTSEHDQHLATCRFRGGNEAGNCPLGEHGNLGGY